MKSDKIAILFNPSAGMGRALREKERLESCLRRHSLLYDLFVTEDEDHLKRLTQVNSMSHNTLVGAGGDSTFALISLASVMDMIGMAVG
ncbi:diacylglycerol kinase family protein, partial [Acidobacteriota bacterium]